MLFIGLINYFWLPFATVMILKSSRLLWLTGLYILWEIVFMDNYRYYLPRKIINTFVLRGRDNTWSESCWDDVQGRDLGQLRQTWPNVEPTSWRVFSTKQIYTIVLHLTFIVINGILLNHLCTTRLHMLDLLINIEWFYLVCIYFTLRNICLPKFAKEQFSCT